VQRFKRAAAGAEKAVWEVGCEAGLFGGIRAAGIPDPNSGHGWPNAVFRVLIGNRLAVILDVGPGGSLGAVLMKVFETLIST
jgi:hypothetical protein